MTKAMGVEGGYVASIMIGSADHHAQRATRDTPQYVHVTRADAGACEREKAAPKKHTANGGSNSGCRSRASPAP